MSTQASATDFASERKVYKAKSSQRAVWLTRMKGCLIDPKSSTLCTQSKQELIKDLDARIEGLKGEVSCWDNSANMEAFVKCARTNAIKATLNSYK